ncbi:T9SS type A sorting domain-containing protein [Marinirhabdus gelatinilytica]|uniref:Putative secreted protein (Por secretion system target) n=1 Tax=Marinirhabdus gelatinilytica TaxID=1703343 RepID=A0A370Q5A6_9FLAO|nr:T9SS type A sorting domain-containing protein [Marinirhabdus gelatinilytica]RDK83479.1 putative secreted protein (Por secretion system target) [Marinirhabdus gelatinilytica]
MKHLLLVPAMLLASVISTAQLYVAPNTTGTPSDSYVYVNDQVLFVEQDVNLTENNVTAGQEASIYLRNDGQLIQGTSNSSNVGSGYISVYRENPGSDAWDYTFYGSPVGDIFTNPAAAPGNINFGAESLFAVETITASNQASLTGSYEGFTNSSANTVSISHRWLYTKGSGHQSPWNRMYGANAAPAGQGFIMKGVNLDGAPGNHDYTYDFRGRPNNGQFDLATTPVTGNHPQNDMPEQELLSGNPYPSALDLNRVFWDTQAGDPDGTINTTNTEIIKIAYWDENRAINSHLYTENEGGFGTWIPNSSNPDGEVGSAGYEPGTYTVAPFLQYDAGGNPTGQNGSGNMYDRRFAPIGQGFYFITQNTDVAAGDLTLNEISVKNSHRRFIKEGAATDSQFRNPLGGNTGGLAATDTSVGTNPGPANPYEGLSPRMRIYTYFDESHFRDMVLLFNENSTDGYDWGMDATHPNDADFGDAYFTFDPTGQGDNYNNYVIQTVPYDVQKKIHYRVKLDQPMQVVVQLVQEINLPCNNVFLWDSQEDTYQKISGNHTASLDLPAGNYLDRFYITFLDDSTFADEQGTAENVLTTLENVDFFQNNVLGQMEISNPERYDIKYAHIFDMTGKLVQTRANIGNVSKFEMNTSTFADGVYVVKLATADNVSIDYKAIVTNK